MNLVLKSTANWMGYDLVRRDVGDDRAHYLRLFPVDSVENRRFYNISAGGHIGFGCGFDHPCWTNIDVNKPWPEGREYRPGLDIAHDLLDLSTLPIESGAAELIHSRFTVEHITDQAARVFFSEAFRALKPRGVLRIVCPNIDLDYRAYLAQDRDFFYWSHNIPGWDRASMEQLFLEHFAGTVSTLQSAEAPVKVLDGEFKRLLAEMPLAEALTVCTQKCDLELHRQFRRNHINWWNFSKFEKYLTEAGFSSVVLSAPFQSCSPVMRNPRFFDNLHQEVALYVEAIKY